MNYANQLKIDFTGVDEAVKPKKGQPFICCDQNILTEAAKHLTYSEYRLFLYLIFNRGYEKNSSPFWLSPTAIKENIGLPLQSYREAKVGLIKKGYLEELGGNSLRFNPTPE